MKSTIAEIEDCDGITHGYYFDENGVWVNENGIEWINIIITDGEQEEYLSGYIYIDEEGYLFKGWNMDGSSYYGENYICYESKLLEEDGKLYYFDEYGNLCTNTMVVVEGVTYQADANGVLTVVDMSGKSEWVQSGDYWYLFVDGKVIYDQFYVHYGTTYYFDNQGRMATGVFWVEEEGKYYFAEESGKVILNVKNGWYYSKETKKWSYFRKGEPVYDEVININGTYYYLDWDGILQTGAFWGYHPDTYEYGWFFADHNGAIQFTSKWYSMNGKWYYVDKNGNAAHGGFYKIGNKKYYFDYEAQMQTGIIWLWDNETYEITLYITDSSGAIQDKPGWNQVYDEWYYINADGTLNTEEEKIIGGKKYYFNGDGSLITRSVLYDDDGNVWIDENGLVDTTDGWKKSYDSWVYVLNGKVQSGLITVSGKQYYMSPFMFVGGTYIYDEDTNRETYMFFDSNGVRQKLKEGWMSVKAYGKTEWYYIKDGKPVKGDYAGFYFDMEGRFMTGPQYQMNYKNYMYDENGYLYKKGWIQMDGIWYYAGTSGVLYTGEHKIGGKTYWFNSMGEWIK